MSRIVCMIAKSDTGDFVNPLTGLKMENVSDTSVGINRLLESFKALRVTDGVLETKKGEVRLAQMYLLANHTGGGELKAPAKFPKKTV